jgi:hypothetical protein
VALQVDAGADWSLSGAAPDVVNDGTVGVSGALSFGKVTHDAGKKGVVDLGDNGTAQFTAGIAKGETLVFTDATGTLLLDAPRRFKATISGFAAGDVIDLAGVEANRLSFADHQLRVTEDGRTVADLHFAGHYTPGDFTLSPDGNGGTDIALNPARADAALWTLRG